MQSSKGLLPGVAIDVWRGGLRLCTGTLACTVAPTGAGCFGFLSWEKDSSYEASVWDIKTKRTAGKVSSDAIGTSYMPAVVVPLPFIAPVRSSACSGLAEQLSSFLNN